MGSPEQNFEIANRYLGWGDLTESLWFIGLEEASEWTGTDLDTFDPRVEVSPHTTEQSFTRKGQAVRALTSRIAWRLSSEYSKRPLQEYRESRFWKPGCKLLQLNFYPLGKARWEQWPAHYKALFGYGPDERDAYRLKVAATRFERIRELARDHRPRAVICFGKLAWPAAIDVFALSGLRAEPITPRVMSYHERRIVLAPFFSNRHLSSDDAGLIAGKLESWDVRLP